MNIVEQSERIAEEAWSKPEEKRKKLLDSELVADIRAKRDDLGIFAEYMLRVVDIERGLLSQSKHPDFRGVGAATKALKKINKGVYRLEYHGFLATVKLSGRDILALGEILVEPNRDRVPFQDWKDFDKARNLISDLGNKYLRSPQKKAPHGGVINRLAARIMKRT